MRETAGSVAAPAARCKNCLRGSFIFEPPFTLFDHLVGALLKQRWHFKAERVGGIDVRTRTGSAVRSAALSALRL
jgi:hypothetical protein